ncbi:membrane protein [Polymorphobacter glacialis]|uniref:Membrane protein n=2 Tax=Sandarakinorhabdus glacialis TaxID=1614636 RepID=A0A917A0S1_9SPHN|nr:membrane protein [Polymorphobacter glacialis]
MFVSESTGVIPDRSNVQDKVIGGFKAVPKLKLAWLGLAQGIARALPAHQFTWHHGNGQSTVKMGTQAQVMAIGSAVIVAGWLGIATSSMLSGNQTDVALAAKQAELARMQNQLQAMRSETAALKGDVAARAQALESRQAFLAALLSDKPDMAKLARMLPRKSSGSEYAMLNSLVAPVVAKVKRGAKAKLVAPVAIASAELNEPFNKLESQQLAFVDKATGAAEAKLRDTQALIRRLGLDPSRFVKSSDWNGNSIGVGGPFIPVTMDAEPRFKDLLLSWKKLDTLQAAVSSIPAFMPVKDYRYTSGYGARYDPFNGRGAMHAGVDMAGAMGEPIYASADGVVLQAGRNNGYGNLVELSHGKGIDTRYGHLSKITVTAGDRVKQGQVIGHMGSTGRSTGTHLHFEVRVDGQAVNPRPFLDASSFMLAAQGDAGRNTPQDFGPILEDDVVTASANAPRMTPIRSLR